MFFVMDRIVPVFAKYCLAVGLYWALLGSVSGKVPVAEKDGAPQTTTATSNKWFYVGQYRTKITPEKARVFVMPAHGVVTDLVPPGQRVKKGTVIARVNKEELELERKTMEVEILKERVAKQDEIQKLQKDRREVLFVSSLTREERAFFDKSSQDVAKTNNPEEVLKSIDDKIELAKKQIELVDAQKRAEFAKKEESFIVTMPFDGRLQYQFQRNEVDEQEGVFIENGKDIAAVCDDSAFYLTIIVSNPEIANIPSSQLKLSLELTNSQIIDGFFSHKRVEKNQGGGGGNMDMLVFYFKVDPSAHDVLYSMLGANCIAKLYFHADDQIKVLSKMELAKMPEASQAVHWQELVENVAPGYELILIGETQLFARKK